MTQAEIARHLFLSDPRQVRELRDRKIIDPRASLDEIRKAYLAHLRRQAGGQGSSELEAVRLRREEMRAEREELELRKRRGELVEAAQMDSALISLSSEVSVRMQALPARLAPEVALESDPTRCFAVLRDAIWDVLNRMAEEGRRAVARAEKQIAAAEAKAQREELLNRQRGRGQA